MSSVDVEMESPVIKLELADFPPEDRFPPASDTTDEFSTADDTETSFQIVSLSMPVSTRFHFVFRYFLTHAVCLPPVCSARISLIVRGAPDPEFCYPAGYGSEPLNRIPITWIQSDPDRSDPDPAAFGSKL